jgi:hypothetical protein
MKFTLSFPFCILFFDCHVQIPNVTSKSQISSDSITAENGFNKIKEKQILNILEIRFYFRFRYAFM